MHLTFLLKIFSPYVMSLRKTGYEIVKYIMLNTVNLQNPTGPRLYTLISVQPGSAILLA